MNKYYVSALSAFVIWGFISLLLKPMHIYPSLDILFYRVFISALIMSIIVFVSNTKMRKKNVNMLRQMAAPEKRKVIIRTLAGGIFLAFNWYFFIYAMNNISIKAATYAYLICPIITTVLAYFILHEKLSKAQWLAVSLSLLSCLILAFNHIVDLLFSLIVAVSYALYLITQRHNNQLDKFFILSLQLMFVALVLLPFFPFFGTGTSYDWHFFGGAFILSVVFTILPLWLNLYALKGVNSSTMGILLYINPLLNFTVAALVFNEPTEAIQLAGYFTILVSIFIFNKEKLRTLFQGKNN